MKKFYKFKDILVDYNDPNCDVEFLIKTAKTITKMAEESNSKDLEHFQYGLEHLESIKRESVKNPDNNLESHIRWFFAHDFGGYCNLINS